MTLSGLLFSSRTRVYWVLQVAGWATVVGTLLIFYWPYVPTGGRFPYFTLDMFLAFLSTFPLHSLGRAAWKDEQHRISRGVLCILLGLLFGFVAEGLSELTVFLLWEPMKYIPIRSLLAEGVDYAILLGCWCVFYFGGKSFLEVRRTEQLVQQAQVLARESQLKALRSQIHPHFLFNSLNAVSSLLVAGRAEEARVMIQRLDELLGAMLDSQEDHMADLSTELHCAKQYLEIQRARFGDRLRIDFDIQADLEPFRVPRWFLLPLLENAVKYGLSTGEEGVPVRVSFRRQKEGLLVTIANKIVGVTDKHIEKGFGIGLQNTRDLLHTIYGDFASVSINDKDGDFAIAIELPKVVGHEFCDIANSGQSTRLTRSR